MHAIIMNQYVLCVRHVYIYDSTWMVQTSFLITFSLQVFFYDGTQSCTTAGFLPFFLIGIVVIVFLVIPVPFVLCAMTVKRWQVRTIGYNYDGYIYVVLLLNIYSITFILQNSLYYYINCIQK